MASPAGLLLDSARGSELAPVREGGALTVAFRREGPTQPHHEAQKHKLSNEATPRWPTVACNAGLALRPEESPQHHASKANCAATEHDRRGFSRIQHEAAI